MSEVVAEQVIQETKAAPVAESKESKQEAKSEDPAWLNPRLEQAKRGAESGILKRFGVEKPEDLEAKLARLAELERAQLSEQERVSLELKELREKAVRASALEESIGMVANRELGGLNELQKAAVVALAGSDPAMQIKAIESLRPTWTAVQSSAPVQTQAAPAQTSAAPAQPASASISQIDHKSRYAELQKTNPFAASAYAQKHAGQLL